MNQQLHPGTQTKQTLSDKRRKVKRPPSHSKMAAPEKRWRQANSLAHCLGSCSDELKRRDSSTAKLIKERGMLKKRRKHGRVGGGGGVQLIELSRIRGSY